MTPEEARQTIVDAIRHDLYGQVAPGWVGWLGARVHSARASGSEGYEVDTSDLGTSSFGVVLDPDGNEIVRTWPCRLYVTGVLYPDLSEADESTLDAAVEETDADGADDPEGTPSEAIDPPKPGEGDSGERPEDDDADTAAQIHRPRSMGLSFLVPPHGGSGATVTITGAVYEPTRLRAVGGGDGPAGWERAWRRRPVRFEHVIHSWEDLAEAFEEGPLRIRLEVRVTPVEGGSQLVTVAAVNDSEAPRGEPSERFGHLPGRCLFQAAVEVVTTSASVAPHPGAEPLDDEEASLHLLYHQEQPLAVGHGCAATWIRHGDGGQVVLKAEHQPVVRVGSVTPDAVDPEKGDPLRVDMDGLAAWAEAEVATVERIITAYGGWIRQQRRRIGRLPTDLRQRARTHLRRCGSFHRRMVEGWKAVQEDSAVRQTLRWTSEAMASQRRGYRAETRRPHDGDWPPGPHSGQGDPATWRAFQLAFLLANIPRIVDPDQRRHSECDVLWLPTGGGKTEAYLAVAAFTILWHRRQHGARGAAGQQGTVVLMRYTLRLLTAQQLQRAAALICALELIRERHPKVLGERRITIGAWLGRSSTPNSRRDAVTDLRKWRDKGEGRPFLLTRCPWCAASFEPGAGQAVGGYVIASTSRGKRVAVHCPDPGCQFNVDNQRSRGVKALGVPVYQVDEDLYEQPPTFLVGTVDKFALLAWRPEAAAFFGLREGRRERPGPQLIIQDELHLIAGPLGSLAALYEAALEQLCRHDGGSAPRVIGATATARRYDHQIDSLYGRTAALIPPPGLTMGETFFTSRDHSGPGRLHVGVHLAGFGRSPAGAARLIASLAHAGGLLAVAAENGTLDPSLVDPWWTNVCFFSSRKHLGVTRSVTQTHLRWFQYQLYRRSGVRYGSIGRDGRATLRSLGRLVELTAQATTDVAASLAELEKRYTIGGGDAVSLAFATSMIEVGVDIERLGLMTVMGQPKLSSQYIQVTGRVGRAQRRGPGLVISLFSTANPRDLSYLEHFHAYHERLYAWVEAASVTPWTPATLERGLGGTTAALIRLTRPAELQPADAGEAFDWAVGCLEGRVPPDRRDLFKMVATDLRDRLERAGPQPWGVLKPDNTSGGFLRPLGSAEHPGAEEEGPAWFIPTSMRSVDAEAGAVVISSPTSVDGPPSPRQLIPEADEEF